MSVTLELGQLLNMVLSSTPAWHFVFCLCVGSTGAKLLRMSVVQRLVLNSWIVLKSCVDLLEVLYGVDLQELLEGEWLEADPITLIELALELHPEHTHKKKMLI